MSNNKKDAINYSNRKKTNADLSGKDLKRSNCYNSNFSGSNFSLSSIKGAQFKKCNFNRCQFESTEFIASNLKNSHFKEAIFKDAIIDATNLEGADFENASFENVIISNSDVSKALNLDLSSEGIRYFESQPNLEISKRLERAVKACKNNEHMKKAGVLFTKDDNINMVTMMLLLEKFTEEALVTSLSKLKSEMNKDFFLIKDLIEAITNI